MLNTKTVNLSRHSDLKYIRSRWEWKEHPLLMLKVWGSNPALSENTTSLPRNLKAPHGAERIAGYLNWVETGWTKKEKRKKYWKSCTNIWIRVGLCQRSKLTSNAMIVFLTQPHSQIHEFGKCTKPGLQIWPFFAKQRCWVCQTPELFAWVFRQI